MFLRLGLRYPRLAQDPLWSQNDSTLSVLLSRFSIVRIVRDAATHSLLLFLFLVELQTLLNVLDIDLPY